MRISFENIFRKRAVLMGIATILILIYHSSLSFNVLTKWFDNSTPNEILYNLKSITNFGVDLFLLLSGFGLFYSYTRTKNLKQFYVKRILRILPEYFLLALIYYAFVSKSFVQYIYSVFFLGLFIDANPNFWFITVIFLFYLIYPLIFKLSSKHGWITALVSFGVGLILYFVIFKDHIDVQLRLRLIVFKLPVFILGSYFGYLAQQKVQFNKCGSLILFVFSLVVFIGIFILNYFGVFGNVDRILFASFYSLSFLFIYLYLSSLSFKESKIIVWIGKFSLEFYLLFEGVLAAIEYLIPALDPFNLLNNLFAFVITVGAAILLKMFGDASINLEKKHNEKHS